MALMLSAVTLGAFPRRLRVSLRSSIFRSSVRRFCAEKRAGNNIDISDKHIPVLLSHVLQNVGASDDKKIRVVVDGTVGAGGHARHILEKLPSIDRYIGIDRDPEALAIASEVLKDFSGKVSLIRSNFVDIPSILDAEGIPKESVDTILLDLGVSSMQLDQAEKGFSFMREGPLDMRMDPTHPVTARDIVNGWPEEEIGRVIRDYGEDRRWRRLAKVIVNARDELPIETTTQLAKIIADNSPFEWKKRRSIHPATLVFQGLRIEVNSELEVVKDVIPAVVPYLSPTGRLLIISFHSLEDRIVKQSFLALQEDETLTPRLQVVTKRPLIAKEDEIKLNSRSRSAKLRVLEKLNQGQEPGLGRKKNKYAHLRGKKKGSSLPNSSTTEGI